MGRKPHKVCSLGQRPAPTLAVCVQACRKVEYGGDADEYGTSVIAGWAMAICQMTGNRPAGGTTLRGTDANQFWLSLRNATAGQSEVLIVTAGAREHAAALGLWDKVLDGSLTIFGFDPLGKDGNQGYVVLESPPTVIRFVDQKGVMHYTWVDPANYGARGFVGTVDDDKADAKTCHSVAEEVREWFIGYSAMLTEYGLGTIEHTAASQAAAGYRIGYMDHAIIVHDNEAVLNLERAALYGGRNECKFVGTILSGPDAYEPDEADPMPNWQAGLFDGPQTGEPINGEPMPRAVITNAGPIYQLDFNSLYPAVARDALLPAKLLGVLRNVPVKTLLQACEVMPIIATVRVRTDVPCVPAWVSSREVGENYRTVTRAVVSGNRNNRRMIFPTGDFATVLCGPEIRLAAKHGEVVSCGLAACYEGRPIYRKWVDTLYKARRSFADRRHSAVADCVKAVLNASFAKWAQLKRRWVDQPGELCPWAWDQWWRENDETGELEQWRCFAWAVQKLVTEGEPGDSFPAITAFINSLGRAELWKAMQVDSDGRVYYTDTDSVWCNESHYNLLNTRHDVSPDTLGKMKLVGTYTRLELFGLKRYMADGSLTVAGAHGETVRTSDAWALALRPMPAHSFLRAHRPPGIDVRTVRMRLALPYRHGCVEPDGSVVPWTIFDR